MARILVVEPADPIRALTRRILILEGHDVVDVATATAALDAASGSAFDLVVTEIDVPDMDGFEFIDRLHAVIAEIPIVVTTARDDAEASLAEAKAGIVDRVAKPFGFGQLSSAVARVLSAEPGQLEELRVIRRNAAESYRSVIKLEQEAAKPKRRMLRRR
jgi:DNA-binding NtrC family response regulator